MEIKFRYVYKREETDEIIFEYFDIKDFDDWGINPEFIIPIVFLLIEIFLSVEKILTIRNFLKVIS